MSRARKQWNARLLDNAERTVVRHRNRRAVIGLTALTVLLGLAGLIADIRFGSWRLSHACYAAALMFGIAVLALLFSSRLRVTRRPRR